MVYLVCLTHTTCMLTFAFSILYSLCSLCIHPLSYDNKMSILCCSNVRKNPTAQYQFESHFILFTQTHVQLAECKHYFLQKNFPDFKKKFTVVTKLMSKFAFQV